MEEKFSVHVHDHVLAIVYLLFMSVSYPVLSAKNAPKAFTDLCKCSHPHLDPDSSFKLCVKYVYLGVHGYVVPRLLYLHF